MKEKDFIESKQLRESSLGRIEVLDKVKEVILLPYGEVATSKQVAEYFEAGDEAINSLVKRNREELESNGMTNVKRTDLNDVFESKYWTFKSGKGKTVAECEGHSLNVTNKGLTIFTRRAILNVAMLLEESIIAKQVRELLKQECPDLYCELSLNPAKFKKHEDKLEYLLNEIFGDNIQIDKQVKCGEYYIDFVVNDLIAIECDEFGHSDYDKEKELIREQYILNKGYEVIRYNPHKDNLISKVIPSILWSLEGEKDVITFVEPY